jgi:hypothetical protein
MNDNELDAILESIHRPDEFVLEPEGSGIHCPRCAKEVQCGLIPNQSLLRDRHVLYWCACRKDYGTELHPQTQLAWEAALDFEDGGTGPTGNEKQS